MIWLLWGIISSRDAGVTMATLVYCTPLYWSPLPQNHHLHHHRHLYILVLRRSNWNCVRCYCIYVCDKGHGVKGHHSCSKLFRQTSPAIKISFNWLAPPSPHLPQLLHACRFWRITRVALQPSGGRRQLAAVWCCVVTLSTATFASSGTEPQSRSSLFPAHSIDTV